MYHASLYTKLENKRAQCRVCLRRCIIPSGEVGWCKTRLNKGGKLFSLTYGRVSSITVAPVEIKPMFHFLPGSLWLSVGSVGCNFHCPGCQNWEIAHAVPDVKGSYCIQDTNKHMKTEYLAPEALIEISHRERVSGISFTYNEPTLWVEYAERVMTLAKEVGLATNWVTNGYLTSETLDSVGKRLDAFRVDIKGFSEPTYRRIGGITDYREILETVKRAKRRWNMHVEIVTNVISGVNDDRSELAGLARWIIRELGPDTPWHITRFVPQHRWKDYPPTSAETLEDIYRMARREGINYPYLGNVSGHPYENTVCPSCGEILIDRHAAGVVTVKLFGSSCPGCGALIPGRFEQRK